MPLQKAVAMRHANVFTARFLCFRSFPVAPSQLKTPDRMKKHFPRLYSGKTHSLRPRKTTFSHQSWPERHLQREEQWHDVCKFRAAPGNTMTNISKTKDRHGASFASYCLEKVDNKGPWAIKTKECERRNETKWRMRQKNAGVNALEIAALNKTGPAGEGLELVRGTKGSQSTTK